MEDNFSVAPVTEAQDVTTADAFDGLLSGINMNEPVSNEPEALAAPGANPVDPANPVVADIGEMPHSKQNQMFAQMRVQNRQQTLALQTILQKAGFDPSLAEDPAQVMQLLENAEVAQQAKDLAVPPELLQRLNYLERINRETESERTQQSAVIGFQTIQNRFGLTEGQLQQFATQLQAAGVNPFETTVDLEREFVNINFDWVVARERQLAVQDALARQSKAYQYGTAPARTQGKPTADPTGDKINTMAQFDRLLFDMDK